MPHQCTGCGHVFEDGSKEMLGGCPDCGGTKFQFHPAGTDIPDEPPDEAPPEPETGGVAERVGRATTTVRDWMRTDDGPAAGAPDEQPTADSRSRTTASGGADAAASTGGADDTPASTSTSTSTSASASTSGSGDGPDPKAPWPDPPGTGGDGDDGDIIDADAVEPTLRGEDAAQSDARRDVAGPDDLPAGEATADAGTTGDADPEADDAPPADGQVVREPTGDRPDLQELREELNDQFESIKIVEPGQYELNLMELYDRQEYIISLKEDGRYVIDVPETWRDD
jgi:hypothetical protein